MTPRSTWVLVAAACAVVIGISAALLARKASFPGCANSAVNLTITGDGAVIFQGRHLRDASAISAALTASARKDPQPRINVLADRRADIMKTIQLIFTLAQTAGLRCVGQTGIDFDPGF